MCFTVMCRRECGAGGRRLSVGCVCVDGDTWREAYGRVLGTVMVASLLELCLSLVPPRTLRRMFPPIVTGTAVFLIGASLVGTGIKCDPPHSRP